MPRFRFVAADSTGQVHDGAIDAATQTDARNKLASNGLAVRELEETAASVETTAIPARRTPTRSGEPEPMPMRSTARPAPAESAGRGSSAPLVLAAIALVISVATAIYAVYRDPFANRLSRYDFSTPEAAYRSHLKMQATADLPAMMELQRRNDAKHLREKLDSVYVKDAEEFNGKTILFIEYTVDSRTMREVQCFEPDPNHSRSWRLTHIPMQELSMLNGSLAQKVDDWTKQRDGEHFPERGRFP